LKELNNMKREDIFNTELIGQGIPDLGEELAKLQNGQSDFDQVDQGFGDFGFADEPDENFEEEEE